MDLTVLIITRNAEDTLSATLKSVEGLTNHIVVVDDYSTDKTKQIAFEYGCEVILHHSYDFGKQRAFALTQVKTGWTLVLDSDEVLTEKNKQEITEAIQKKEHNGFYLQFRNHLFGKKLLHGELHKKPVLFKTANATSFTHLIHEKYEVSGTTGELKSEVNHYSYRSLFQLKRKFFDYAVRQAKQYKLEDKKYGLKELFLNPIHMFYARFIKDGGYKDGLARIILDSAFAKMEFFSYFFIPFVKEKERVSVDCGSCDVNGIVQGGIDRVIQGIHSHKNTEVDYYWFGFHEKSIHRLPRRFYSQLWLPLMTILKRCDVFVGTGGTIPWILQFFPIKKIVFIYDFGFFTSPHKYNSSATRLQSQTENSVRWADRIVVLNEEMYKEFIQRYPHYCHKVECIPSGADHLNMIEEKPAFISSKRPFVLAVGVVKPIKRIEKILSSIGDIYCVIAGPHEEEYVKTFQVGKTQHVQFIQNFNDGQLKWLYRNASAMLYASESEGFCYPVLEALILGLPVIAFDLPLFKTYQKYFPHLTLITTEGEMKEKLKKINDRKFPTQEHPYKWETFNRRLDSLVRTSGDEINSTQKVGFITVLYNTSDKEKQRLEQEIKKIELPSYTLYWVDNSSNKKGYAAGINEGVRLGLIGDCDYFVALNPDVSLDGITADSFLAVSKKFSVWGYGMEQDKKIYYGGKIDKWRLSGGLITQKPEQRFASVDFISGSVLGFSKEIVQKIGLWDESYFMYYEDVDYCERARRAGFTVGIDSETVYKHFEVSQLNIKKKSWIAKSRWKFFWNYANSIQKIRELIRLPKTLFLK